MGLLGDVFSIGSSIIGGNSAKKASKKAQAAQQLANLQAQGSINNAYGTAMDALAPYTQAGAGAQTSLNNLLGISAPTTTDWAAYVNGNRDALANWNAIKNTSAGAQFGGDINAFGQYHYQADGSQRDLTPYTSGGGDGTQAQADAISALQGSPLYESLFRNGEQAILQNAAATGGLRGGNIQSSLANFGRDTLSSVIQNQIANLSGVANNGLSAANSAANTATGYGANLAGLLTGNGDIAAGGILQRSAINSNTLNQVGKSLGNIAGTLLPGGIGGIKF